MKQKVRQWLIQLAVRWLPLRVVNWFAEYCKVALVKDVKIIGWLHPGGTEYTVRRVVRSKEGATLLQLSGSLAHTVVEPHLVYWL